MSTRRTPPVALSGLLVDKLRDSGLREIVEMAVPPGNHRGSDLRRTYQYVARFETRRRPEGRPYPQSQQVIRA